MRKENGPDFVSLLQDEAFFTRVKETNGFVNQLDLLEKEFSATREAIACAVEFIKTNLSDQKNMPAEDVGKVWNGIQEYAVKERPISIRQFIYGNFWKVAAMIILVLASSVFVVQRLTRDTLFEIASMKAEMGAEAMIILSDGSKHKLNLKDSLIEYSSNGSQIVVKGNQQEEKLENLMASAAPTINQVVVPFGRRHSITLSDGTRVQLNSGSRLVFPAEFTDKNREVYLKGEGYFEVTKNAAKPFIVKTDFTSVRVLGTVFNISAYEDELITTTVLVEGTVVVAQNNKLFGFSDQKLRPGQGCFYSSETKTSEIRNVDLSDYISWKDGLFLFRDKPLKGIASRLEKYYNQKILIEDGKLPNTLISGKLVLSDNFDEVMQYLTKTLETRFEKNKEGVYLITN